MRLFDYAASANCLKVRILIRQLGLDVGLVPVDIFTGDTLTDEYRALNPASETPVLELPSGAPLAESNAILLYLADGSPLSRRAWRSARRSGAGSSSSSPPSSRRSAAPASGSSPVAARVASRSS